MGCSLMDVEWTPKGLSGASCSHARAWSAQGQGTITLQEPTMPSSIERMMASLMAWHIPKSSAWTNNKRASAGYPKRSFVGPVFRVDILLPLPESSGPSMIDGIQFLEKLRERLTSELRRTPHRRSS